MLRSLSAHSMSQSFGSPQLLGYALSYHMYNFSTKLDTEVYLPHMQTIFRVIIHLSGDLALNESQRLWAVLVDILLVRVGVVAVAAVGVGRVAVRLDDTWVCRGALEAGWTGGELTYIISLILSKKTGRRNLRPCWCKCQHCMADQQRCVGHPWRWRP